MLQNLIITFVQSVRHQVSHSSTLRVEEELNKLKTLETAVAPTAETICNSLLGLKELYKYINDLNLHLTFQALSHCKHEKLVEDLLDKSVRLLDVCYTTKEPVSQCKENDTTAGIKAITEANAVCSLIFQMLLQFWSLPLLKPKPSKWSLVSRLVSKGKIARVT
uniref:Uncharacterized protein n=1 Tax=Nicotiana tabacum TaxID=4097 RepID=A0A1S4AUF7_TOBAC|nr:PREDICTED: uncharacterized protein LOC107801334 [Nicotiana tabacum]